MGEHHHPGPGPDLLGVLGVTLAVVGLVGYLTLVALTRRRGWPWRRTAAWVTGVGLATAAVVGPLARAGHAGFTGHMVTHLLLGMVVPVLLVFAAPVTLALRALPVVDAREVGRVLRSRPVRVLTEPAVAATLAVGGMWLLYLTPLYAALPHSPGLQVLVHGHFLLAGYLFTVSIVSVDPLPHRRGIRHRAVVLVLALAAHDILAKVLFARPPVGVDRVDAETGAMAMYYGGTAVDLVLAVLLCARWYRATRPAPGTGAVRVGVS